MMFLVFVLALAACAAAKPVDLISPLGLPYDYRFINPVIPQAYPTTNLIPKVTKDGFLEETPEVIAAKINHFAEVNIAKSRIAAATPIITPFVNPVPALPTIPFDYRYVSPLPKVLPVSQNIPVVTPEGFLADTPEVAAAKAQHFAEVAAARTKASLRVFI